MKWFQVAPSNLNYAVILCEYTDMDIFYLD